MKNALNKKNRNFSGYAYMLELIAMNIPVHYKYDIASEVQYTHCSFDFLMLCLCKQITINELPLNFRLIANLNIINRSN